MVPIMCKHVRVSALFWAYQTDKMLTRRTMLRRIYIYPSCVYYMTWFVASDQVRQLSLLRRRHKATVNLQCTDEAQNKPETRGKHVKTLFQDMLISSLVIKSYRSSDGRKSD